MASRVAASQPFTAAITFFGGLSFFLNRVRSGSVVERVLKETTSVKDAIEACGVPHPEVDMITVNGRAVDFSYVLNKNSAIDVYPVRFADVEHAGAHLQRLHVPSFVADGHLGKLTRNLRLLGIDIILPAPSEDRVLLEIMQREDRALLTRDRRLLMHRVVRDGYYPRSQDPDEQTVEIIRRFALYPSLRPFSRCLSCNGCLEDSSKEDLLERLEPLTRRYYDQFRRCRKCGKIYWRGSHFEKLRVQIEVFREKSAR